MGTHGTSALGPAAIDWMATEPPMSELMKTPLNAAHRALNAKMVDFGGWDMPVQYPAGIIAEHEAVRTKAGLFDVSHMGEIRVKGPGALALVEHLTPNAVSKLAIGQVHYTAFLYENGTFVDDLLVYREGEEEFLLVVNAGNSDKDFAWVQQHSKGYDCTVVNESPITGQIALQGPLALDILQPLTKTELAPIGYYWFAHGEVAGIKCLISRTGYTGEDGFELYVPADGVVTFWNLLLETGKADGLLACGLAARDSLRFEACMPLYGHELSPTINPLEARLNWTIAWDKPFIGREALLKVKLEKPARLLVGLEMVEKAVPREHYDVAVNGQVVGHVTSGMKSPTLDKFLAMAYVPAEHSALGTRLDVIVRGQPKAAVVVKRPFYKPKYK